MKILHILGFAEDQGGVLSVIRNLQAADIGRDSSHSVWVQDCYKETRTPHLDYRFSRFARDGNISPTLLLNMIPALLSLRMLLKSEQFDIIHAHSRGTLPLAVLITKLLRRPVIYTNHNYASRKGLYRWASKQPRMYTVVLTPNMAGYYDIDTSRPTTRIIPAFCADRFFDEALVVRRESFSPESPLRLVGTGVVTDWKGWHTVCEAFALLDSADRASVQFTQWGDVRDAKYGERVTKFVKEKNLENHIHFMGPTNEITAALSEADWLMHPAIMDPFPVSVIEALALGLPALVSESGGPVDMIKPYETGLFFEPNDSVDLAEKIRVILHGEMQPVAPERVRESVRDIAASRVATRYHELYVDVLTSH